MTASFRRIDYSLRPAKHAERKMLCDVFRRLWPFGAVENYLYVGFGSVWFSDFTIFHRALGIRDMISIEQAAGAAKRIEANKPFKIDIDFRASNHVLPELDWERKAFLWLDYDDPLSTDMLLDVQTVANRAQSGTVLVVSVQCHRSPMIAEAERERASDATAIDAVERFRQLFGRDRVPSSLFDDDLIGWPYGALSRSMLLAEIEKTLAARNGMPDQADMRSEVVCEFEYEDGAKMTTLVVVFYEDADANKVSDCGFAQMDFLKAGSKLVRIPVPKLTVKEFRQLEQQLPLAAGTALDCGEIPPGEASQFAEMYRYLPNFAVIEGS
ncbi:O-methyltransferase [Devosia sp. ZW T5_3]|uniref:O-methyltransferase n=1 Tax=Devosia sp. ZW T5_3 TaxID=3378085 RepID=UPI0038523F68